MDSRLSPSRRRIKWSNCPSELLRSPSQGRQRFADAHAAHGRQREATEPFLGSLLGSQDSIARACSSATLASARQRRHGRVKVLDDDRTGDNNQAVTTATCYLHSTVTYSRPPPAVPFYDDLQRVIILDV